MYNEHPGILRVPLQIISEFRELSVIFVFYEKPFHRHIPAEDFSDHDIDSFLFQYKILKPGGPN